MFTRWPKEFWPISPHGQRGSARLCEVLAISPFYVELLSQSVAVVRSACCFVRFGWSWFGSVSLLLCIYYIVYMNYQYRYTFFGVSISSAWHCCRSFCCCKWCWVTLTTNRLISHSWHFICWCFFFHCKHHGLVWWSSSKRRRTGTRSRSHDSWPSWSTEASKHLCLNIKIKKHVGFPSENRKKHDKTTTRRRTRTRRTTTGW